MTDAPSWWWADLGGLPAPRPAARRRPRGRRLHRRRRLHRPVDRLRAAARPTRRSPSSCSSARWPASAPRAQRRLGAGRGLAGVAPARGGRARPRSRALERAIQDDRRRGRRRLRARGHRLRLRQGRLADRRPDRSPSSRACASAPRGELLDVDEARRARARRRRCAARATRRTARACSRRSSCAAWRRRSSATAGRSTRARPRSTSRRAACGPPRARCARAGSCAPPRATPRRCPASSARCCRCRAR